MTSQTCSEKLCVLLVVSRIKLQIYKWAASIIHNDDIINNLEIKKFLPQDYSDLVLSEKPCLILSLSF